MKIGILTLHEADSYGALLQAYALQQVLTQFGAQSEFLSFCRSGAQTVPAENVTSQGTEICKNKRYDTQTLRPGDGAQTLQQTPGTAGPLVRRIQLAGEQRHAVFEGFRQTHLVCASPCPQEEAAELNQVYDCFIAGSDQVWNPQIPGVNGQHFLPFAAPSKRYSYAASFGSDTLPEQVRSWCGKQLTAFQGLSVREESGRHIIKALTGRDAAVHLDPTLLLSPERWSSLTHEVEGPPYALLFLLKNDTELVNAARETARQRGLELRIVTGAFLPQFGFAPWNGTGVEQWLSLIRHAACVFTNSFHGAVFSLLFARPVQVTRLTGQLSSRNGRIVELLGKTGMEAAFTALCPAPSPDQLAERIGEDRENSMNYLRRITANETFI